MKHLSKEVSFPIAKLLQEKGYSKYFFHVDKFYYPLTQELTENKRGENCPAPTVGQVVDWIYENHGVWIEVNITRYGNFYCNITLKEKCKNLKNPFWELVNQLNDFNSPTEAYEAAFEYFLNNLIEKL